MSTDTDTDTSTRRETKKERGVGSMRLSGVGMAIAMMDMGMMRRTARLGSFGGTEKARQCNVGTRRIDSVFLHPTCLELYFAVTRSSYLLDDTSA